MVDLRQDGRKKTPKWSLSRRRFLLAILGGGFGVVFSFLMFQPAPRLIRAIERRMYALLEPRLDVSSASGTLSEEEMKEIIALAEVLFPRDLDAMATQHLIRSHVNRRTTTQKGYLEEYKRAVALLERTTKNSRKDDQRFSALSRAEREGVLSTLLKPYRADERTKYVFEKLFASREISAFRVHVIRDLLMAFYRSPEGWKVVGYSNFPGMAAEDPMEYTRPLDS